MVSEQRQTSDWSVPADSKTERAAGSQFQPQSSTFPGLDSKDLRSKLQSNSPPVAAGRELDYQSMQRHRATGVRAIERRLQRWLLRLLLRRAGSPRVRISIADDEPLSLVDGDPIGEIRIADPSAFWSIIFSPELGFGDRFSDGRLQIKGDLFNVLVELYGAMESTRKNVLKYRPNPLGLWVRRNSRRGSQSNIHHHYDLGNEFYKLWLDQNMVYTCAYYFETDISLEQAQLAKLEHVCRKLELKPGQDVVELGCGWGALAIHMARYHGVRVKAFNISKEQLAYARERARSEGVDDRVEFVDADYRDAVSRFGSESFDAVVSIGMLEHVGVENYVELGDLARSLLREHGRGLIHNVGRARKARPNAWLEQRIFPGSYPPALSEMMSIFEPVGLLVLDVENLRRHYAYTLCEWLRRFDQHRATFEDQFGLDFVRAWRLYLAGCAAGFETGGVQLYQVTFSRALDNSVPMTRAPIYQRAPLDLGGG